MPGEATLARLAHMRAEAAAERPGEPWLNRYPADVRPFLAQHGLDPAHARGAHEANLRIAALARVGVIGEQLATEAAELIHAFVLEEEKPEDDPPEAFDWHVEELIRDLREERHRQRRDGA